LGQTLLYMKTDTTSIPVNFIPVETLGKCEHCGKIIGGEDYADSEGDEVWHCKHCRGIVGHASFGYDKPVNGCKKVRWVGPGGEWVDKKPKEDFRIGSIQVTVHPMRFPVF